MGVVVMTAVACSGESTQSADDALIASQADAATTALFDEFWDASSRYMRDAHPSDGKEAGYWTFAQAFDAVLDGVQRTGGAKFEEHIATFYNAQEAQGWARDWFDDENWMALALIRAYDVTKNHTYIKRAEWLFDDIVTSGRTSNGIWWDRAHTQKATASNFGPAITAARLYERTGHELYKVAALEIYDDWYSTMVNRTTYQVADHRRSDGSVDWSKYTYDTGLAIGASVELFHITQTQGYLSHAYGFGSYLIHEQVASSPYGNILHDDHCSGDCDAFKGIAYRFLTKLYELDTQKTQYGDVLHASARAIWGGARDVHTNLFASDWGAGPPKSTSLAADASAVMALNLAAEHGL